MRQIEPAGDAVRNGGQAQCASGRLKRSQWIERWGLDTALRMHEECLDGMETFKGLIKDIDCDPQPGGHLYVAHRAKVMPTLEKEAKLLRETFNYDAQILDADTVKRQFVGDEEAAGAMHEPEGIGIHAGKLAFGYLKKKPVHWEQQCIRRARLLAGRLKMACTASEHRVGLSGLVRLVWRPEDTLRKVCTRS